MNAGSSNSCREIFKELDILPLHSQYIFSLLLFVVKNADMLKPSSEVHTVDTQHGSDLHPPLTNLTKLQKGVFYSGIKIFNCLPQNIKNLSNDVKKFRLALKGFLRAH
jgi:hypothetical protein